MDIVLSQVSGSGSADAGQGHLLFWGCGVGRRHLCCWRYI